MTRRTCADGIRTVAHEIVADVHRQQHLEHHEHHVNYNQWRSYHGPWTSLNPPDGHWTDRHPWDFVDNWILLFLGRFFHAIVQNRRTATSWGKDDWVEKSPTDIIWWLVSLWCTVFHQWSGKKVPGWTVDTFTWFGFSSLVWCSSWLQDGVGQVGGR